MRVIRSAGENVSPSDDGRLYDQIFTDGLFNDTTFVNLGGNNIQCGSMYGDLCGRDFTIEQMVIAATLPEGEGETTGYIYVEIDTASDDVITLNTALAPFTPTYENINTNGAIAQMIVAEYTATAVAVQSVTPVYKIVSAGSVLPGSVATVEVSPATQNHSVGEFILYGGQLYSVTSAITAGQSLTPGTNISATSAGSELSSLKSGLTRHFLELNETNITTTSGTIQSSSIVRITYNNHNISIDYYIRVASSTGRPTITINGFPTLPTNITSTGFPTHARVGTTNYITDSNYLRYTAGTTYATLTFYNYLGEFPAGNGYFVASGNMSLNY